MMGLARPLLNLMPNLIFWKLLGSGTGEGFTPKPNWGVYAILCVWQDPTNIEKTLKESRVFRRYHEMATESVTIHLEPYATRGEWSGQTPFRAKSKRDTGPVAVLTRATLRWNAMLQFWKQSPAISTKIGMNEDVLFKIGLGEVPLRQQLTFSIWPDIKQMSEFAHQSDPHRSAIQKVRQGDWFKEELYARFNITAIDGHWSAFGTTRKKEETNE
ncbi:MAG: spheroidene monooxygenase [Rhodobacteraceae bacterium]|nr:spheroidene monooxygenase [Paracoccaceae bacterium]